MSRDVESVREFLGLIRYLSSDNRNKTQQELFATNKHTGMCHICCILTLIIRLLFSSDLSYHDYFTFPCLLFSYFMQAIVIRRNSAIRGLRLTFSKTE